LPFLIIFRPESGYGLEEAGIGPGVGAVPAQVAEDRG